MPSFALMEIAGRITDCHFLAENNLVAAVIALVSGLCTAKNLEIHVPLQLAEKRSGNKITTTGNFNSINFFGRECRYVSTFDL